MPTVIDVLLRIRSQTSSAVSGIGSATTAAGRFQSAARGMAAPAVAALGGILALGKGAADSASRTEQAMGSLESVFGKNADTVKGWAATAANSVGLAQSQYGELAAGLGAQLKNMGLSGDQAKDSTKDLISLGADLSAAFGGSASDAVEALGSALRGEADPAEKYGLSLNQTTINAELAARGQDKLTGAALKQAKTAAILALAHKQAGGAIGQFARESDTAAGAQQRAAAQFENARSELGTALLPVVSAVSGAVGALSGFLQQNAGVVRGVVIAVAAFATAILAVNAGIAIYNGVQKLMAAASAISTAAQWAFNAAVSANPIALIVIAIAAFVGGIVLLWNKSTGFRNFILAMWKAIQQAAVATWNAIKSAVSTVINFVVGIAQGLGKSVVAVWNGIKSAAQTVWGAITGIVQGVVNTVSKIWSGFIGGLVSAWHGVSSAAQTVWGTITGIVQGVITAVGRVIGTVVGIAKGIWTQVTAGVQGAWSLIKTYIINPLQAAFDWVHNVFGGIAGFFSGLWQGIVDTATGILSGIANAVSGAFSAIKTIIANVINGIISFINNTVIWGLNKLIDAANLIPYVDIPHIPNIPLLSSYGVQAAPADGLSGLFSPGGRRQDDNSVSIVVNGALDSDGVARQIGRILTDRSRRVGVLQLAGAAR